MGSFGAALRRTREEKGISLDEIAGETRLSRRYLLALEDEAIHKLPGGTYNRAYLRSYAAYLGLDIARLVHEYSLEEAHQTKTGRLTPQADVLASLGRAVEGRRASPGARRAWDVNWNRIFGLERPIALFGGLGLLAVVLLTGLIWTGFGGFRQETTVPAASAADGRTVASQPAPPSTPLPPTPLPPTPLPPTPLPPTALPPTAPPPRAAVALPRGEPLDSPRTPEPPAVTSRSGSNNAVASPRSTPAPVISPPVVTKPVTPAPERAGSAAIPPRTSAAPPAKGRTKATNGRLSMTSSGVGIRLVGKRLVGESDTFAAGTRVTFWTRVAGGRAGDTISHVWFYNGVRIGATSLRIGSSDWRTQSNQLLLPDGRWAVEARDADGRVLVRHDFRAAQR